MEKAGGSMTMGAPVNVGRSVSEISARPSVNEARTGPVSVSEKVSIPKIQQVPHEPKMAGKLVDIAKQDGVDDALEKLAVQDESLFEKTAKEEVGSEDIKIEESQKTDQDPEVRANEDPEFEDNEQEEVKPRNIIEAKVQSLEGKVERLIEENKNLGQRLEKSEELNKLALESIHEMAEIIRRLLEDEEASKKDKESLLEILAKLMAKLMGAMFVPNEEDGVSKGQSSEQKTLEKLSA